MRRYFDWLIPLLILMAAIAWRAQDGPLVTELRNKVFDVYQRILPRSYDPKTSVRILAIDESHVVRVSAEIDAGRPLAQLGIGVGAGVPVARCPIGGFEPDLPRALELGRVRVPRSFALPEVEDGGRVAVQLRGFAPVPNANVARGDRI